MYVLHTLSEGALGLLRLSDGLRLVRANGRDVVGRLVRTRKAPSSGGMTDAARRDKTGGDQWSEQHLDVVVMCCYWS